MEYIITRQDDELYHYGVKGMKWGVRRAVKTLTNPKNLLNKDGYKNTDIRKPAGTLTDGYKKSKKPAPVTSLRQASKKARADGLAARKAERNSGQLSGIGAVRKGNKIQREATKDSLKEYKQIAKDNIKDNIKEYDKKFEKASSASDSADAKWVQVREQRKKLGKNAVSRFIASAQNKTAEAKAYNKMFDDAYRSSDKADAMWREAQEVYKKTGRTYVSRILNNVRYGS